MGIATYIAVSCLLMCLMLVGGRVIKSTRRMCDAEVGETAWFATIEKDMRRRESGWKRVDVGWIRVTSREEGAYPTYRGFWFRASVWVPFEIDHWF